MGMGTADCQLNQKQVAQAKQAKTSEILKNSTVIMFLTALGVCFSTCSYSITKGFLEKKQSAVKNDKQSQSCRKTNAQNPSL